MICVPPAAPITKRALPVGSTNIEGAIDETGRFPEQLHFLSCILCHNFGGLAKKLTFLHPLDFCTPGIMKLFGEGGTPKEFVIFGAEKSSL